VTDIVTHVPEGTGCVVNVPNDTSTLYMQHGRTYQSQTIDGRRVVRMHMGDAVTMLRNSPLWADANPELMREFCAPPPGAIR
jgi:hypothetical protein